MKRYLLFALLIASVFACKKSKKEDQITPETLLGDWQSQVLVQYPNQSTTYYTFRKDSTFTTGSDGFLGPMDGTYSAKSVGPVPGRMLDVKLTMGTNSKMIMIEIKSSNLIVIAYGGTIGQNFVRRKN